MHRSPVRAFLFLLLVLAGVAIIGVGAYNMGAAHGFAEAARNAALPPEGTTHVYVWPGPWHGGFFPFFPFFALLFLFVLLRGLLWRGAWRGGRGGCGQDRFGRGRYDGVPPAFDEWHRRAHERMAGPPPPPPQGAAS